jgi:hypothetical protein
MFFDMFSVLSKKDKDIIFKIDTLNSSIRQTLLSDMKISRKEEVDANYREACKEAVGAHKQSNRGIL